MDYKCSMYATILAVLLPSAVLAAEMAPAWPNPSWQPSTASQVGMDQTLLEEARDYAL